MSNKSKWIKAIGVAATVIGVGVNLITDWVNEQKMDEKIEEKVSEALARRDKDEAEESYHLKSRSGIDLAISKALKDKKTFNETKWINKKPIVFEQSSSMAA